MDGKVVLWNSAGAAGFKGSRKSTPFAATTTIEKLLENARVLVVAILKAKPPAAKGRYLRSVHISSTMGPGVQLDTTNLETSVQ